MMRCESWSAQLVERTDHRTGRGDGRSEVQQAMSVPAIAVLVVLAVVRKPLARRRTEFLTSTDRLRTHESPPRA